MTNEKSFEWDNVEASENSEENRPFLNLEETGNGDELEAVLKFEENEPFHVSEDNYGNDKLIFKVEDIYGKKCLFSTSSKRCMVAIKGVRPLKDKTVRITRTGKSFDTTYEAEEI